MGCKAVSYTHLDVYKRQVCGPMDDQQVAMPAPMTVTLRVARASKVIGMPLSQQQCAKALVGLGLPVVEGDGVLSVTPLSLIHI